MGTDTAIVASRVTIAQGSAVVVVTRLQDLRMSIITTPY